MDRTSFENFKSNVCHRVKDIGAISFIEETLTSDIITELYDKQWYPECLYMLAMVDYQSRINDIPLYNAYDYLRTRKLEKIVYPAGIMTMYLLTKDEDILKKSFDESIPEFKRFNIVENEIEKVA